MSIGGTLMSFCFRLRSVPQYNGSARLGRYLMRLTHGGRVNSGRVCDMLLSSALTTIHRRIHRVDKPRRARRAAARRSDILHEVEVQFALQERV